MVWVSSSGLPTGRWCYVCRDQPIRVVGMVRCLATEDGFSVLFLTIQWRESCHHVMVPVWSNRLNVHVVLFMRDLKWKFQMRFRHPMKLTTVFDMF